MKRLVLAVAAFALPFAAQAQQPFTMKLAGIAVNDPSHAYLKEFKDRIEAKSGGRIKGETYPGAQLGGFPQMIQGVQFGTIELYMGPPGMQRGLDARMQVVEAPGLFDDMEHGQKTITDPRFRDKFAEVNTAKGLKGITFYNYGPSSYASNTPLRKLDDFKGKKFRVLATKVEIELMNRLGASGVPMDLAEVLPALQNKTLDGVRSSIVVMGAGKYFTVTKYITDVQDSMIPIGAWVSTAWLTKLPADLQKMVLDTGREMEDFAYRSSVEFDNRAAQLWKENGAEVIKLSPQDQAEFLRRARGIADEVMGNDPALKELYSLYKEVADAHRKKG
jgi:TRAP-type transport system periplasmic protein